MAIRTNATNVGLIIEVDSAIPVTAFIEVANELVTELCTGTNAPTPAYSASRLEQIERWLAAHFYAIRDPRATSEKAGAVGQSLQSKVDIGLDVTHYGQQAMRFDTQGKLAELNRASKDGSQRTVSMFWGGTDYDL